MNSMKIPGLVFLVLFFLTPWCSAGSVPARNTTAPPAQPYITIDPVANHTADEVFYITGIAWVLPKEELSKKSSTVHFGPSKNFTEYINAPSITGIQKIDALRIASTSTLDSHLLSGADAGATHKKFGDYLKSSHGPITFEWAYPYTGIIRLSMPVGNLSSNEYGLAYAHVNIDNQSIQSEGFVDWHKYW